MFRSGMLAALCILGFGLHAEDLTLPITADNSLCIFPGEQVNNMGQSPRIKLKGMENMILLNFDATPLQKKVITKAVLRIKGTDKNLMVHKVGFSTITAPWNEGKQGSEAKAVNGDSCYQSPDVGSGRLWAGTGSCFLDVIHGRGGSIWSQSYVKKDDQQWYEMEIDPRLMAACASGLSYGLCLSDDNGQTTNVAQEAYPETNHSNNFFYSREQSNAKPEIRVTYSPAPTGDPAIISGVKVAPWMGGANFDTGAVEVTWPSRPTKAVGYKLSIDVDGKATELPVWQSPTPPPEGEQPRALLRGLPADAKIKVTVTEYVGAGVFQSGSASGAVSAKLTQPAKLELKSVERAAGDAPSNAATTVWVLPDACKANPVTGNVLEEPGVKYEGDAAGKYPQGNPVWSGKERTVYLTSLKGEWMAFQIVCQNAGGPQEYTVTPGDLNGPNGFKIPADAYKLSRLWYQKTGKSERGWYADPMLPLANGAAFKVPDEKNAVPGQQNQTVYTEFFVPKEAPPGPYTGTVSVKASGGEPIVLNVQLDVGTAKIPDRAAFVWSMNAYGSPGADFGKNGSQEFIKAEQDFYTLAHMHRTCLSVLHYSHGGDYDETAAPPVSGTGKNMKVSDWSNFDKRFGPLLDGSAFKGTPREGVPMDHFYLVMAEHYPTKMSDGYKWDNLKWEEHWLKAGPINEGFSQAYKDQWAAVAADQMKHFKEKNYGSTFQVYLNDKYFYKQYDAKRKPPGHGRGVCFWLLDEPMHIDDYHALEFFGKLFREGQKIAGPEAAKTTQFRVDISRPNWGRDTVDRIIDLNVTGGFGEYRPWLEEWRARHGQHIWTYGGAPASTQSALGIAAQALDLYGRGVDGFVPWLTLGGQKNWKDFEDTCVYYTGKPFGIQGACASLRLKAYRRGEQDIEYVKLLAEKRGLLKDDPNRLQVNKLLQGTIQVSKQKGRLDAQGAETESFGGLRVEDFENLRRAIKAQL